ncbi:MAG: hypothetical protein AABX50_01230 [Nanoarchaeota archaeon]
MKIDGKKQTGNINHNIKATEFLLLKNILLFIFILTIFFPMVSAVEVSMNSNFSQGETLLAKFSGNFIDQITKDNIVFYRENVRIPMIFDVKKINDEFYLYALLPYLPTGKTQSNYSLRVENIRYMKATQIVDDDIISNFTISNETAIFSVDPGVLITNSGFNVEVQNLQDRKITLEITEDIDSITSLTSIELKTGEKKTISFTATTTPANGIETIEFSSGEFSYELPVYFDTNQTSETEEKQDFEFQPSTVEVQMATGSESKRILYLKNTGNETIEDISFRISSLLEPYIVVSPDSISSLKPGENEKIEIQIASDQEEAVLEGRVTAYTENISSSLALVLDFIKDFIPAENESGDVIVPTCEQLDGTVCATNQECSEDSLSAKDGPCCLAQCREVKKSSSGKYIGWGLLILAVLLIYWFYKRRYRNVMRRRPF